MNNQRNVKQALLIGIGTFFLATIIGFGSQYLLGRLASLVVAFLLIGVIIFIGIIFDIIGLATAAAGEAPFHAMSSRRIASGRYAISMVRNADKVASFCNDVIGDICGTLSGAIGAALVVRLAVSPQAGEEVAVTTLMTAAIAALTVGGKAMGKNVALNRSEEIVLRTAQVLAWLDETSGFRVLSPQKERKNAVK